MVATVTCGGGTYIRALARDLGRASGSAAHLSALRRTASGSFDVANAVSLDALESGYCRVQPPLAAIAHMSRVTLGPAEVISVRHGRMIKRETPNHSQPVALVDESNDLIAIAEPVDAFWQPRVVLSNA
jgi:tRNA pseudouridine55 synthase